jgi:hypothetical protein
LSTEHVREEGTGKLSSPRVKRMQAIKEGQFVAGGEKEL